MRVIAACDFVTLPGDIRDFVPRALDARGGRRELVRDAGAGNRFQNVGEQAAGVAVATDGNESEIGEHSAGIYAHPRRFCMGRMSSSRCGGFPGGLSSEPDVDHAWTRMARAAHSYRLPVVGY